MPFDFDIFNYSNGNLATVSSAKWTKLSGFADLTIASLRATGVAATDCASVITAWSGETTSQYSLISVDGVGTQGGPTVCSDEVDTFYVLMMTAATWTVAKCVAGVFTDLDTVDAAIAQAQAAELAVMSNILVTRLHNGPPLNVLVDTSIASGKPGIFIFDTALTLLVWQAGTPVAPRVDANYQSFPKPIFDADIPALVEEFS